MMDKVISSEGKAFYVDGALEKTLVWC